MKNAKILNLPLPDAELINYIRNNYKTFNVVSIWPKLEFEIYEGDPIVNKWVDENISNKWMSVRIFYIGKILPIHIDINRDVVLNYIIQSGEGITNFYEFYDKSLYNFYKFSQKIISTDLVEHLESVKISDNTWYKINCSVPHSVTDLISPRILLTIAFKKDFNLVENCQTCEILPTA